MSKLNNNAGLWYKGPQQENNKGEQRASKILEIILVQTIFSDI